MPLVAPTTERAIDAKALSGAAWLSIETTQHGFHTRRAHDLNWSPARWSGLRLDHLTLGGLMKKLFLLLVLALLAGTASAQFTRLGAAGRTSTNGEVADARLGTYVTLTGNVVAHQREDYFTFREATGEIRVEIGSQLFAGRKVSPETRVELLGEIDRGPAGRYVWVKSLKVLP
jgi:uncharacterized protein (TIGR00156 family)